MSLPIGGEWFRGAGLGVFVHWDHASQQGVEVSWPVVWGTREGPGRPSAPMGVAEYHASAETFDPQEWDAKALAVLLAEAGVGYAVFTARHHAGYAMFDTEHSDFGVTRGRFGRDVVAEYADALHEVGVRVGLYYSLPDWHHPDYPAFTDADRPYPDEHWVAGSAEDPRWTTRHRRSDPAAWARFQTYLRGQLSELLTNYGQVDLLWFDGEWERSPVEWDTAGLRQLIRDLQPAVVVNDRLLEQGDYVTPEQGMPREAPAGPWELCLTIGDGWQYSPTDTRHKSPRRLAAVLSEVVARGGNLLLNVGPTGTGALPDYQVQVLRELGGWLRVHRDAVIGVEPAPDVEFYGPVTRRRHADGSESVYLHLLALPVEAVVARGLPVGRVVEVVLVATGATLATSVAVDVHGGDTGVEPVGELQIDAPVPSGALVDVIEIVLRARR